MAFASTFDNPLSVAHSRDIGLGIAIAVLAVVAYFLTDDLVTAVGVAGLPLALLLCYRSP